MILGKEVRCLPRYQAKEITEFDSLETAPNFIAKPNMRFGATYLDMQYRDYSASGELLVDKVSGEHFIHRKEDGRFISFDRHYRYAYELMTELNIVLANTTDFIVPDTGFYFNFDFDMFLLNDHKRFDIFSNEGTFSPVLDEDENPIMIFRISKHANGFILRVVPRDSDRAIIEYLTACYNERYSDYSGDDPIMIEHNKRFSVEGFYNSNCIVTYKVRGVPKNGSTYLEYTYDAVVDYCRINETIAIKFPNNILYGVDRSKLCYIEVEIVSLNFLKLSHMRNLVRQYPDVFMPGYQLYQSPDNLAIIPYVNVIGFTDVPEQIYELPISKNLLTVLDMDYVIRALNRYAKIKQGAAVIVSEYRPPSTTWTINTEWKEILCRFHEGSEIEDLGGKDTKDDIEEFLNPKRNKRKTYWTINREDFDGIWLDGWDPTSGEPIIDAYPIDFGDGRYLVDRYIAALTTSDGKAIFIGDEYEEGTGDDTNTDSDENEEIIPGGN